MGKLYPLNENSNILRKCKECKKEYPQLIEHFWRNSGRKDGLEYICKECSCVKKDEFIYKRHKYRKSINYVTNTQICKDCGKELSLTPEYFGRRKDVPSGYDRACKNCRSKSELNFALKQQKLIDNNIWTCTSCHKDLELNKINFHKKGDSPTKFSYRCKTCVQKDPYRFNRKEDNENLKYYLNSILKGTKARTKKKKIIFDITYDDILQLYVEQEGKCAITKLEMTHIM